MRVLITDGNERAALAVTRALGSNQIEVIVGAERASSLAGASKYCSSSFIYPSPYDEPGRFIECLLDVVQREGVTTLIPISDIAMQVIGPEKSRFEKHAQLPVPPHSVFEAMSDKYRLAGLAAGLDIPIPDTVFVSNGAVEEAIERVTAFPVVVKPGRSLLKQNDQWVKTNVHYAKNREELRRLYDKHSYLRAPSLIQRRVVGEGQGVFVLMNQGEPLAMFAHRRLREKPPSGGVSVLRESMELPKDLADYALRLLQHERWHGVAMVEFKRDRESGIPRLMEVNGRFWGSLQLATDAGLNFPVMLCEMASGRLLSTPKTGYRIGVKSRWLLGDLDHLLLRLLKPHQALNLPPEAPSKWRCVADFCRFFEKETCYEVERWSDLGPWLYELKNYAKVK